jgi:hypothetical protein
MQPSVWQMGMERLVSQHRPFQLSRFVVVAAVAALGVVGTAANGVAASSATGPVSTVPATNTPRLMTTGTAEQIRQIVQCGSTMYAVGTFTEIARGNIKYIRGGAFSFSATAPYKVTGWDPEVNGTVSSIAFNGANCADAYLGGKFKTIGGTTVKNIAEVDTTTGAVVTSFKSSANAAVYTLLGWNGHLLTGGAFTSINGSAADPYFTSLNPTTGRNDNYLALAISGHYVYTDDSRTPSGTNPTRVYNQQLSNDGTRDLIEGDFTSVGGQPRQQIAMLDLGATNVTTDAWYAPEFNANCAVDLSFYARAASWSPDDSMVYVATTGYKPANGPGFNTGQPRAGLCDAAVAFPSTSTTVNHLWINYTGCDSLFSTAADASTAYFGGHERWIDNPDGCDHAGPGAISAPGMVGLSPTDGSMTLNPTRGRGMGADDMLVTSAGLWIANDNFDGANQCGGVAGHAGLCFLPYTS